MIVWTLGMPRAGWRRAHSSGVLLRYDGLITTESVQMKTIVGVAYRTDK